jgi:hypothetical protein
MKKPVLKIFLIFLLLSLLTSYKEFKKGFIEGYYGAHEMPGKTIPDYSNCAGAGSIYFPLMFIIY